MAAPASLGLLGTVLTPSGMDQDNSESLQERSYKPVFKFASYDTDKYPFAEILAKSVFDVDDLSRFHESYLSLKRERGGSGAITHKDNMAVRELLNNMDKENEF
ncbi:MAG: hypothetical protein JKX81_13550, partial [Arenicella sp.]|nr:hypothetical protein [Arenicella sp.]